MFRLFRTFQGRVVTGRLGCYHDVCDHGIGMTDDRLMTTGEIAAALHVSRQTVTRWIREGRLEAVKLTPYQRPIYRVRVSRFRAFVARYVEGLD